VMGSFTVTVFAAPAAAIENGLGDSLRSRNVAEAYRWYLNGQLLGNNSTSRSIRPLESGIYSLELVENNCSSFRSTDFPYFMTAVQDLGRAGIKVYPNPSQGLFRFERPMQASGAYSLHIEDVQGRTLRQFNGAEQQLEIDLRTVPAGVYLLRYSTAEEVGWMRLVKTDF